MSEKKLGIQSSMVQKTKRCHWVPKSYLKNFAADPPEAKKIWRLGKLGEQNAPELKSIEKVGVKFHLYSPFNPKTGQRDDSFEHELSELDAWFADPVWKNLCNNQDDLSQPTLRKFISLLVSSMQMRNPASFDLHKNMHRQIVQQVSSFKTLADFNEEIGGNYPTDIASWQSFRDAGEEELKANWIENISIGWYARKLILKRWSIICAETPTFITTDNPVVAIHPDLQFRGVDNPNTMIMFPLSPTRLLRIDNRNEPNNQYYALRDDGAVTNALLWRGANNYMFSHRHPGEVCDAIVSDAESKGY